MVVLTFCDFDSRYWFYVCCDFIGLLVYLLSCLFWGCFACVVLRFGLILSD